MGTQHSLEVVLGVEVKPCREEIPEDHEVGSRPLGKLQAIEPHEVRQEGVRVALESEIEAQMQGSGLSCSCGSQQTAP